MSTNMADGAAQRLDAQIADALFGQPGMSKLDVANLLRQLRQLRGNVGPLLCGSCFGLGGIGYTSGQTPEQFEQGEYPCPDCAQPSPAGQGDALATLSARWRACADQHDENAREADSIGDMTATVQYLETKSEVLRQVAAELEAALADRQPVAAAVKDSLTVGCGQAWVVADGQGARWRMWGSLGPEWTSDRNQALHFARRADAEAFANDDEDAWLIQPAGVPAQAVDLEQFRWAVELSRQHHSQGSAFNERVIAECDRLLALIYSKAPTYG